MASVWIARHSGKHGFEKFVAVKTVLPKFAADARFQQMFQDEARIASRIEHVNVAQILDVGEQHDITYLVMEYVDGDSLSAVHRTLNKKGMRVPPGVVLRILADVCGGLHSAHELRDLDDGPALGVVHRDVSPQNVLVSTKGVVKLIDFGIAKARDRIAGDTNAGQVKGKIRYMAPEQAVGGAVDRRADIWAVGAILYHLLTGKPPYDGDNDVQALMVLTSGRPPVPLPPTVHPAIAAIVKRAMMFGVDGRYTTAAEMQQAIEDAMDEAKIETNSAAVAAFLAEHVAERAKKRKEAIAIGVKAAAERERYAEIMRSNVRVTVGSGTVATTEAVAGSGGSRNGHESNPGVGSRPGVGSNPGAGSNPGVGSRSGVVPGPTSGSGPGNSLVTSGTLGSAAMDVGVGKRPGGRTVAFAGVAAGAVLGIAGLMLVLTKSPAGPKAVTDPPASALSATGAPATSPAATTPWTATTVTPALPTTGAAPTVDANAGPSETSVVPTAPPRPPVVSNAAPRPPMFHTAPKPPSHTKTRIDDGF
jgi:serine/threonine-protein kinase